MPEELPEVKRNPVSAVIHKLGEIAGVARPDWFAEETWELMEPAHRRMVRIMHDRGGAGFRIFRSAETGPKNYSSQEDNAE